MSDEAKRIIQLAEDRNEFLRLEDGYIYYEPMQSGAFSARNLRAIADELDRRNAQWDAQVQRDMEAYRRQEEGQ